MKNNNNNKPEDIMYACCRGTTSRSPNECSSVPFEIGFFRTLDY